ncbi:MAG: hypothetical protein QOD31_1813 [Pseudonocardiales bacterium]|nr:hypothetical protein [Pseudonocardiales bacterium]
MKNRLARLVAALTLAVEHRPHLAGHADATAVLALLADEHGAAEPAADDPLARLAVLFDLSELDTELFFVAAAADLDVRFGALYSLVLGNSHRQRPSAGLTLELCGYGSLSAGARHRLSPAGPLRSQRLLLVEGTEPMLWRSLAVPERVIGALLGDDSPDPELAALLLEVPGRDTPEAQRLSRALLAGSRVGHVKSRPGTAGLALARGTFDALGLPSIAVDLSRRRATDDAVHLTGLAVREAGLLGAGLILTGADDVIAHERALLATVERGPMPAVVVDALDWEASWLTGAPLHVEASELAREERAAIWAGVLDPAAIAQDASGWGDLVGLRLTPQEMLASISAASVVSAADGQAEVSVAVLRDVARRQGSTSLQGTALRVAPRATLKDLELTDTTRAAIDELIAWARHREALLAEGSLAGKGSKGRGLTALFAGSSGTGKTLAAEAVAGELGLDLYTVELATIIDKYIGETEKNLERVIREAESLNVVLFFDEADALFGSRSEVKDARDRYANQEVSYLLQRIERFDGIAVLATNLRGNIDPAFSRRLHHVITFLDPDAPTRRRLWAAHLEAVSALDVADEPDLDWLAGHVEVTGGSIRNIVMASAFAAASQDSAVGMRHLVAAVQREYQKLGRRMDRDKSPQRIPVIAPQ